MTDKPNNLPTAQEMSRLADIANIRIAINQLVISHNNLARHHEMISSEKDLPRLALLDSCGRPPNADEHSPE